MDSEPQKGIMTSSDDPNIFKVDVYVAEESKQCCK